MFNVVAYENTIKRFAAAGVAYEVLETKSDYITFRLSKDGFGANVGFDFGDEHIDKSAELALTAFLNFVEWNKQEQERQERKRKRAERGKPQV